jgi:hypothetical protein
MVCPKLSIYIIYLIHILYTLKVYRHTNMVFLCCLGKPNVLEDVGQLPNDQDSKSHPEPATPPHAGCKFVFDENNEQIIGIDNSGRESKTGFRISDALLTLVCALTCRQQVCH